MESPKNRTALAVGVTMAAAITTAGLAMVVWPALTRPDPPLEKADDNGLRIALVQPPKAATATSSPLDVGLSEAAKAMAKGREALFVQAPSVREPPPPARPAPVRTARIEENEDLAPPPEPADDRWEREAAWRRDRFEQARLERAERRRWEEERLAEEARAERSAWERDRQRWEDARERERYEDQEPPPLDEPRAPPPGW